MNANLDVDIALVECVDNGSSGSTELDVTLFILSTLLCTSALFFFRLRSGEFRGLLFDLPSI